MRFIRCVAGCIYCAGQGQERRNKGTARNEEVRQTNMQKEEKFVGTSTEDIIRKNSQVTFILSHVYGSVTNSNGFWTG
jgi:hypothetical protein